MLHLFIIILIKRTGELRPMLDKIFGTVFGEGVSLTIGRMLLIIIAAIVLGFLISALYLYVHRKENFIKSYIITIVMLPPMIAIIILLIGDNIARAFSLAGAFSLVRYRSAAGDPSDICFIFFSLAVGLACGLGYLGYGFVFFILLSILTIILHKTNYGTPPATHMTLKITIPENLNYNGLFDEVLDKYTTDWNLNRVKTVQFGSLFDLVYSIELDKNTDQKKFIDELRTLNGNLNITLVLSRNESKVYD